MVVFLAIRYIERQGHWKVTGVTLTSGFGVVQGHWKWRRSMDHVRLSIGWL